MLTYSDHIFWGKLCPGILHVGSLWPTGRGRGAGMGLIYPASSVPCIANYRRSINVHEVIGLLISDFYFVRARMDLLFQRQYWQERSHGGGREEQLCWVGCAEDKTQLWYQSWPNLRHWLCNSTVDNQVPSGVSHQLFLGCTWRLRVVALEVPNGTNLSWHIIWWSWVRRRNSILNLLRLSDIYITAGIVCSWISPY